MTKTTETILNIIRHHLGQPAYDYVLAGIGKAYFKRRGWVIYREGETNQQREIDRKIREGIPELTTAQWSATEIGIKINK